ncbi:MAG: hypothetical protein K6B72_05180 [Lachnospiraceae bacterium]|nr:hypothetical protein [Lachnospiraceae bacterium]
MAETLAYENYTCMDEVPHKYDALFLHGFGMIDSEAMGNTGTPVDHVLWTHHLEFLLSNEPKK